MRVVGTAYRRAIALSNADAVAELIVAHDLAAAISSRHRAKTSAFIRAPNIRAVAGYRISNNRHNARSIDERHFTGMFCQLVDHTSLAVIGISDFTVAVHIPDFFNKALSVMGVTTNTVRTVNRC